MNKMFRKFFGIANERAGDERAGASPAPTTSTASAPTMMSRPIRLWNEHKENELFLGGHASDIYRSRLEYVRQKVFAECLRAWHVNPLARRIVSLQTDFIIGEGLGVKSRARRHAEIPAGMVAPPAQQL